MRGDDAMPHRDWWAPTAALAGVVFCSLASAAAPVAIVEDSSLSDPGAMDYLDQGRVLTLKPGDRIILGYLNSCIREEIQGGTVTIGATESNVSGSKVKRSVIPCGGTAQLSQAQAGKSGAMVFRRAPGKSGTGAASAEPSITVPSLSPVLRPSIASGTMKLQRLDRPGEPVTLPGSERVADLQALGIRLAAGGVYRVTAGQKSAVFRIDPAANDTGGALLTRLVHF